MTKNVKKEVAAIQENSQLMTGKEVNTYLICTIFFCFAFSVALILS